ncbi:MAG TPA: cytochrome c biogenesis protein CcsA [Longimicrobiales bacterium]
MVTVLHLAALAGYVAVAALLGGSLAGGRARAPGSIAMLTGAAVVLHAAALAVYTIHLGEPPLVGLAPSLSALGFLIGAVVLATTVFRESRTLGVVLTPVVAILLGTALALGLAPAGTPVAYRDAWLYVHVALSFVGYAGLTVAFAAGLVYLLQFRELKGKRFGRVFRFFPALDTLDVLGRRALAIGFPAFSLGLLIGFAWSARFQRPLSAADPKVVWGALIWLVFLAALGARAGGASRCRRGALVCVVGYAVVVFAYVVLRLAEAGGPFFL